MTKQSFKYGIAAVVRKFPWAMQGAQTLWRFTRPRFSIGVVGVVFNAAGEVLLVEHVFHPYTPWGLPGGWVERGEQPDETLVRELHEELQLNAVVTRIVAMERPHTTHLDLAYLCRANGDVGALSGELLDYRWCDPDQLPAIRLFHRQAIQQAVSVYRDS